MAGERAMTNPITPEIVCQLRAAADPSISPNGRRLAYTQSWVDCGDVIEAKSRIVMMDLADGSSREFTRGNRDSVAKFSPDGRTLAFLRADGQRGREVWVMDADGGEARPLDGAPGKVFEFSWSPDSKRLVISADVDPDASLSGRRFQLRASSDGSGTHPLPLRHAWAGEATPTPTCSWPTSLEAPSDRSPAVIGTILRQGGPPTAAV